MSKERLEELINRKPSKWGNLTIYEFERDIKILQEQAERVEELEKENIGLKQDLKDVSDRLEWVSDV